MGERLFNFSFSTKIPKLIWMADLVYWMYGENNISSEQHVFYNFQRQLLKMISNHFLKSARNVFITSLLRTPLFLFSFIGALNINLIFSVHNSIKQLKFRDGFGPSPAQIGLCILYIPNQPKVCPGSKVAQRTLSKQAWGRTFLAQAQFKEMFGRTSGPKWPKSGPK